MIGIYFTNKWKSQRFGKIINKIRGILINQELSTISIIYKVGYSIIEE